MKKYDVIPILFWIGLSLFAMILSYQLGLEQFDNPGPGLMPFLVALLLLIVSMYLLIASLLRKNGRGQRIESVKGEERGTNFGKIIIVLISLFGYAFLLEILGYLITTCFVLILLFSAMGSRWKSALLTSVVTVLITYFVFTSLGLMFPEGIIKLQGFLKIR